jgi:hypothetical protein
MKQIFVFVMVLLIGAAFAPRARADSPDLQPWMVSAASQGYGGSTPDAVRHAFGNFQNARAKATDKYDWQGDYQQAVTDFLHQHGCVTCGIGDDGLTYPVKIDLPIGVMDFYDILPVQFQTLVNNKK